MPIWPFGSKQPKVQDEALGDLAQMFRDNFGQFEADAGPDVTAAGPRV